MAEASTGSSTGASNGTFFTSGTYTSLDSLATHISSQANEANTRVNASITQLGTNPDNPATLANLQHNINKWSVIYNIHSTVIRSFKDLMQGILQKI